MAHTISRMYANKADADAAVEDLGKHGFAPEEIFVVGPPAGPSRPTDSRSVVDEIADKIAQGFILKSHASEYAKKVAKGAVFVTVYAPFGAGLKATVHSRSASSRRFRRCSCRSIHAPSTMRPRRFRRRFDCLSCLPAGAIRRRYRACRQFFWRGGPAHNPVTQGRRPLYRACWDLPVMTAEGRPTSSVWGCRP